MVPFGAFGAFEASEASGSLSFFSQVSLFEDAFAFDLVESGCPRWTVSFRRELLLDRFTAGIPNDGGGGVGMWKLDRG